MKQTVITAESITAAHSRGETELAVPYRAVVTPAALDMANSFGIRLQREAPPANRSAAGTSAGPKMEQGDAGKTAPNAEDTRSTKDAKAIKDTGNAGPPAARPDPPESPGEPSRLFDEVKQRVLARLPAALHTHPLLDEALRKSLAALSVKCQGPARSEPAGAGRNDAPGAAGARIAKPETAWQTAAGKALCVRASALPWQSSPLGSAVNVIDVVGGQTAASFAAGYMEWEAASFAWTLERDELFTVLQGELRVRAGGKSLHAGPGDMLYLPKGTEAEFSSSGYVKTAFAAATPPAEQGLAGR